MTTKVFSCLLFIGVDLLDHLLTANPRLRPTANEALSRKITMWINHRSICFLYLVYHLDHPFFEGISLGR